MNQKWFFSLGVSLVSSVLSVYFYHHADHLSRMCVYFAGIAMGIALRDIEP